MLPRTVTQVGESFKRTLPQSSRVGNAAHIRRRTDMPSYPPGYFRHAMPQRVGVQRRKPRYQRSRFGRRKYPRSGSRVMAMRPSRGAVIPSEARRKCRLPSLERAGNVASADFLALRRKCRLPSLERAGKVVNHAPLDPRDLPEVLLARGLSISVSSRP
eukprot:SAG11_NODE_8000_length_1071_cov_6.480453_1_plen_159_part_00